jgi:hypothetical protein
MHALGFWRYTMKYLVISICIGLLVALSACSSPEVIEKKSAYEPLDTTERKVAAEAIDFTKDWRVIAAMAPPINYGPEQQKVAQLLWRRRNWRMTLSGEWVDDLVEDMQRRFRWDRKLTDWVNEKGNPEWPK